MNNLQLRLDKQQEKIKQETEKLKQLQAQQAKKLQAIKFRDTARERKALAHLKHTLGGMVYKMGLGGVEEPILLGIFCQAHKALSAADGARLEQFKNMGMDYMPKAKTLPAIKLEKSSS